MIDEKDKFFTFLWSFVRFHLRNRGAAFCKIGSTILVRSHSQYYIKCNKLSTIWLNIFNVRWKLDSKHSLWEDLYFKQECQNKTLIMWLNILNVTWKTNSKHSQWEYSYFKHKCQQYDNSLNVINKMSKQISNTNNGILSLLESQQYGST